VLSLATITPLIFAPIGRTRSWICLRVSPVGPKRSSLLPSLPSAPAWIYGLAFPERKKLICAKEIAAGERVEYKVATMDQPISLLLIDDDQELCALMKAFFAQAGILAEAAFDGRKGLDAALAGSFDVIVLDITMPEMDGFEVLCEIRAVSLVPIIMLTARTGQQDRIAGLDAGADDYLAKPFEPQELLARIRAVLRRARPAPNRQSVLEISGIRLDPDIRRVWHDRREINLTSIEFAILELLMRAVGRVVSRDELSTAIYRREASPNERTIDVHVSNIRKKIETRAQTHILTVRGSGYLFKSR
jgi:two-component system response regulator CpxR